MTNSTNKYCTPVGLQQPAAADLSDGTTGTGAVILADSPTLTGTPAAPTATSGTNTTQLATTAFVLANGASSINIDLLSPDKSANTVSLGCAKFEYQQLAASATATLIDYAGTGYIHFFNFSMTWTDIASATGTLSIYRDGEGSPSVSMPLHLFFQAFGLANTATPNNFRASKYMGVNAPASTAEWGLYTTIPIPFTSHIKITMTNGSGTNSMGWGSQIDYINTSSNSWPFTRKFWAVNTTLSNPAQDSARQFATVAAKGRLLGIWVYDDEFKSVSQISPLGASWEGDWRIYFDQATKIWIASTAYSVNDTIIDSNGNLQTVASISSDAKTGGSQPTWSTSFGTTTTDNHVIWTFSPGAPTNVWRSSTPNYKLGMTVVDTNGNIQKVTTAGTTNSTQPSWNVTPGGTTPDNTITWTNQGVQAIDAGVKCGGAEDLFMAYFYGNGLPGCYDGEGGLHGSTFCNTSPLSNTSVTRSFYRWFTNEILTFNSHLSVHMNVGDSSEVNATGTATTIYATIYYYTET